ncbi:MAG: hypothetical protein ACHQRM_13885 [Bacteroidia bacterium]
MPYRFRLILFCCFLWPCLALAQKDTSDTGMQFDVGIGKARNLRLWPIVNVINEKGLKKINLVFSLFGYKKKHEADTVKVSSYLFPLWFYKKRNKEVLSLRLLSLGYPSLFHYEHDLLDSTRSYHLLEVCPDFGLVSLSTNPNGTYSNNNLLFLLWYGHNRKLDRSYFLFLPFYANYHYKGYDRYWVTPLFTHKRDSNSSRSTLFPVFWNWQKTKYGFREKHTILFPLYFANKTKDHDNKILFPFVFSLKNEDYRSFTLVPVFSAGHSIDGIDAHFSIGTIFWHFKKPGEIHNILFPVWWQGHDYSSHDSSCYNVIFPLWWSFDNHFESPHRHSCSRVLFPVVWMYKNPFYKSFTLFPIYSKGYSPDNSTKHFGITALYWHKVTPHSTFTTFIPFWWTGTSHGSGQGYSHASRYGQSANTYHVFFPFWWDGTNTFSRTYEDGKHDSYSSSNTHKVLFPLWWEFHHVHQSVLEKNSSWSTSKVLFPVYWNYKSNEGKSLTVFPFYSKGNYGDRIHPRNWKMILNYGDVTNKQGHTKYFFPFYYKSVTPTDTSQNILLLAWRKERTRTSVTTDILWPLYQYTSYKDGTEMHLFPIIWFTNKPDVQVKAVLPFFYIRRDTFTDEHYILWPLYTRTEIHDTSVTTGILWKVLEFQRYKNGDASTRFLHLVYAHVHKKGNTANSLFPFYYYSSEADGSFYHSLLLSFYNYRKQKVENTPYYYQEERIFWLLRLRSNYGKLKEKGITKKRSELR